MLLSTQSNPDRSPLKGVYVLLAWHVWTLCSFLGWRRGGARVQARRRLVDRRRDPRVSGPLSSGPGEPGIHAQRTIFGRAIAAFVLIFVSCNMSAHSGYSEVIDPNTSTSFIIDDDADTVRSSLQQSSREPGPVVNEFPNIIQFNVARPLPMRVSNRFSI